jgi:hypothetical protein
MNIYELITPSDPITFKAINDKVAFICALLLGNGKAGCKNALTGENIPTMLAFSSDPEKEMISFIGGDVSEFIESNKKDISKCFLSFAYGSVSDRQTYDSAIEAITEPEKLKEFKEKHEDQNRSSLSKWVQHAWNYGEKFKL